MKKWKHHNYKSEYITWCTMRSRCLLKSGIDHYIKRGIKISERWMSFDNFLEDMGPKPSKEYQIDRIDNDGDYEPTNCRWVTRKQNCNNRSTNNRVTDPKTGEQRTVTEWCDLFNFNLKDKYRTWKRYYLGVRNFDELFTKMNLRKYRRLKKDLDTTIKIKGGVIYD